MEGEGGRGGSEGREVDEGEIGGREEGGKGGGSVGRKEIGGRVGGEEGDISKACDDKKVKSQPVSNLHTNKLYQLVYV